MLAAMILKAHFYLENGLFLCNVPIILTAILVQTFFS